MVFKKAYKMKYILVVIISSLFNYVVNSQVNMQWAKQVGNAQSEAEWTTCVDAFGNVYVTGGFTGTVDFDPGIGTFNITAASTSDNFILKLDPSGNLVSVRTVTAISVRTMYIDPSGNIYTAGQFTNTTDFDPGPGTYTMSAAAGGNYLLKLDALGNFVWARKIANAGISLPLAITSDALNNVYTTGYFISAPDFDPGPGSFLLLGNGGTDVFISKLDVSGNFVWAKQLGGTSNESGSSININSSGNIITSGSFAGIVDFDPGAGTYTLDASNGGTFISQIDGSGNFVTAQQIGGSGRSSCFDSSFNLYVTGIFNSIADFDPSPSTYTLNASNGSFYVTKLDPFGNFIWARQMGVSYPNGEPVSISADISGVYTAGYFQTSGDFDSGPGVLTFTSLGGYDSYISKLDPSGNFLWAEQIGGTTGEIIWGLAVDAPGNVYTSGTFDGTTDFDPGAGAYNLTSVGGTDVFIHKLTQGSSNINETGLQNEFIIKPNPVSDKLFFKNLNGADVKKYVLLNSQGKEVLTAQNTTEELDVSSLPDGLYFLQVQTKEGVKTKKIVIEH